MNEVILIYPSTGFDVKNLTVWLPLSLLHIAADLDEDFKIIIIDQRIELNIEKKLAELISDNTVCVGISAMTGDQINNGLYLANLVRINNSSLPIIWGGIHPTLLPENTAQHPLVDIVVIGQNPATFKKLVIKLSQQDSWESLPNICYLDINGNIQSNHNDTQLPYTINLDELKPLPYHLLEMEKYITGRFTFYKAIRALPYISSFGCPHNCSFCCQPMISKRCWQKQSAEIVVENILNLKEKYNLDGIDFQDENFLSNIPRAIEIANKINNKVKWACQARIDDILKLDIKHLVEKGLCSIQPGVESGSERILKLLNKKLDIENILAANKKLAETKVNVRYNFIVGFPTETKEEIIATVELALKLLEQNPNAGISGFYIYTPYPGTGLFETAIQHGFIAPDSLEQWAIYNRQHINTPWIQPHIEMLQMLVYSSKFIDGRIQKLYSRNLPISLMARYLSGRYRRKWKNHDFRKSWDILMLEKIMKTITK
jgi:anaerobic magnesium-protoporphyrin IX monomethyl ester cyclase